MERETYNVPRHRSLHFGGRGRQQFLARGSAEPRRKRAVAGHAAAAWRGWGKQWTTLPSPTSSAVALRDEEDSDDAHSPPAEEGGGGAAEEEEEKREEKKKLPRGGLKARKKRFLSAVCATARDRLSDTSVVTREIGRR